MEEDYFDIQYRFFVVDDKPFCLWDTDIQGVTLEFLDSIDPSYFDYIADSHLQAAIEDKSQAAALAIRTGYSQGLETLFALIAAAVQAPQCVPAWVVTYRNSDLNSVIERIGKHQPILSLLKEKHLSWSKLSHILHLWLVLEDKEKETAIKEGFAKLWSWFARDFLDQGFKREFNSIKHGLRIRPGGFYIALGLEDEPGVPAEKERMQLLGQSDYGSSYLVAEKLANTSYHIRLKRHLRNWNPEDFGWGLHLISMSISNVISSLKALNDVPATELEYQWPTDLETFSAPWEHFKKLGVTSMTGFQKVIPEELIEPFPKQVILTEYEKGQIDGIKRFRVKNQIDENPDDTPAR